MTRSELLEAMVVGGMGAILWFSLMAVDVKVGAIPPSEVRAAGAYAPEPAPRLGLSAASTIAKEKSE